MPKSHREALFSQLKAIFDAPNVGTARQVLEGVLDRYAERFPRAMACLAEGFEDATAAMGLPAKYRRLLRSTNMVERLIREVRRRERVSRIFPNMDSAFRLLRAYLMEQDEDWISGSRSFSGA